MPARRAMAAAVSPLSPVTTCIRRPARWTRSIAAGDLGPGRIEHGDQAEQAKVLLCILAPGRDGRTGGQDPPGDREDP